MYFGVSLGNFNALKKVLKKVANRKADGIAYFPSFAVHYFSLKHEMYDGQKKSVCISRTLPLSVETQANFTHRNQIFTQNIVQTTRRNGSACNVSDWRGSVACAKTSTVAIALCRLHERRIMCNRQTHWSQAQHSTGKVVECNDVRRTKGWSWAISNATVAMSFAPWTGFVWRAAFACVWVIVRLVAACTA